SYYFPAPGPHTVEFRAIGSDFEPEIADTLSVITDTAAPTVSVHIATPTAAGVDGILVRPATRITLSASAPAPHASGLERIRFSLNGATQTYAAAFTLAELGLSAIGRVDLAVWAEDRVGNTSSPQTQRL